MLKTYRIEDLVELLGVSRATLDRWLAESRAGKNDFPLPFSRPGRRLIWTAEAVESWIEAKQKEVAPNIPPKSEKQKAREFIERQERAQRALQRHGLNRKTNPCEA